MLDTSATRHDQTKDAVFAALVMNGWSRVFEEWWKTHHPHRSGDQLEVDHAVGAYLGLLANDIADALTP